MSERGDTKKVLDGRKEKKEKKAKKEKKVQNVL
jgi:hypothetical protein